MQTKKDQSLNEIVLMYYITSWITFNCNNDIEENDKPSEITLSRNKAQLMVHVSDTMSTKKFTFNIIQILCFLNLCI